MNLCDKFDRRKREKNNNNLFVTREHVTTNLLDPLIILERNY